MPDQRRASAGRPRLELTPMAYAATRELIVELGYASATTDRVAVKLGVAKTTIYRRWPSKGALIIDFLLDSFGSPPLDGDDRSAIVESVVRYAADKIAEPGMGDAFAGVFSEAVSDTELRELLRGRFQAPYLAAICAALNEPEDKVQLLIDIVTGTLLHRLGLTGEPMSDRDVAVLTRMVLNVFH